MNPARRATAAAATTVALATAGTLLTTVTPASAAVTCTSPVFKRQFFANTSFSGPAKKTDCDRAIDEDVGFGLAEDREYYDDDEPEYTTREREREPERELESRYQERPNVRRLQSRRAGRRWWQARTRR